MRKLCFTQGFIIILRFIVVILFVSLFMQNSTIDDQKNDITQYQNKIENLQNEVNNVSIKYTTCQDTLNITQYELENYQCPEIPECPKSRIYDVNRDRKIDFNDVNLVLNYIDEKHSNIYLKITGYNLLYDVNVDNEVNINDAEAIWTNRD